MPQNIFTGPVAEGYDLGAPEMSEPALLEATVRFLADTVEGGAALEFGIGTGRVAIPLSQRGVEVHGIDISEDMVRELRKKPGSESIDVTVGDFATTAVPGTFVLVYLVYNALSNLTTQAEQVACFRNAARHLEPGGRVVVEMFVPDLRRFPPGAVASCVRCECVPRRLRHHRRCDAARCFAPLLRRRRPRRAIRFTLSLRLASGNGSHGSTRGLSTTRTVGGLGPVAVHEREQQHHLSLGTQRVATRERQICRSVARRSVAAKSLAAGSRTGHSVRRHGERTRSSTTPRPR